jgi:hypothetical protein
MKLAIGLPSYRQVDQRVALAWMQLASHLTANGIAWETIAVAQCAWLGTTLNTIMRRFVQSDADRLLVLDDDIVFGVEDAFRLILSPLDVVGGDYPLKARGAGMVCSRVEPSPGWPRGSHATEFAHLRACHTIGLGFSCLSRAAVEKVIADNPTSIYQVASGTDAGQLQHALFHPMLANGQHQDDDIVFFARLRAAGFTPWVDDRIALGHIGTHVYTAEDAR